MNRGQAFRGGRQPLLESVTFSTQPTENGFGKIQAEIEAWRRRETAHFPLVVSYFVGEGSRRQTVSH
ncbi:hypothetical protein PFLUV_G00073290 [Perca fluviatilis]|uniref:Uncharacterized protein n=1 Tax=Perca fluviatilis TaxID=8168 RepID=A0A6A5FEN6_PERFL|nr:hypothetical protein PFLUV_G00073290 [Perca fluviatilis]